MVLAIYDGRIVASTPEFTEDKELLIEHCFHKRVYGDYVIEGSHAKLYETILSLSTLIDLEVV